MCVSPYIATDKQGNYVPVPCGKCIECLRDYQNEWSFRLGKEMSNLVCPIFVTLTYNDENVPVAYNNDVCEWQSYVDKHEVQLFLKRLRKMCPEFKNNLRYFALGEYGKDGNRAHYHIVLMSPAILYPTQYYMKILRAWQGKGFIYVTRCEKKQIRYVTKYLNKIDQSSHITKPFRLMSKSIGLNYLSERMIKYFFDTLKPMVKGVNGWQKMPRYYKKKLDEFAEKYTGLNWRYPFMNFTESLKMHDFKPKGLNVYFSKFVENYANIYVRVLAHELLQFQTQGITMRNLDNPNVVFGIYCETIKAVCDAQYNSNRQILNCQVRHGKTRINQNRYG